MTKLNIRKLQWLLPVSLGILTPVASADVYLNGADVGTSYSTSGDLTGTNASNLLNIDATNGGATSLTIQAGDTIMDNDFRTIYIYGGATLGDLTNFGTIIGDTGNPIYVTTSSTITSFSNSGLIQSNTNGIASFLSYGTVGTFLNSGTIEHTGSSSAVIYNNATSVRNTGLIKSNTGHGVVIGYLNVASGGDFVNDGTIVTNGASGIEAVQIGDGADADVLSSFTNNGIIRNTGAGAAISVNPNATVTNGITNTGLIDGAVSLNTATLNLNGTSGRITGPVSGSTGSAVNVNGTFTTEGTVSVDTFNIASGGLLSMAHTVTATTFTNGGTLSVPSPGVTTLAGSGTSSTISGNYVQSVNGVLRTNVADGSNYSQLVVTGTATLPSNARIDVNVADPGYIFSATRLQDIIVAGTLASDGTFAVTDNSTLFNFNAVKDGDSVDLTLSAAGYTGVTDAVMATGNTMATGAAAALDTVISSSPSSELSRQFLALTSSQQVSDAVSQSLPAMARGIAVASRSAMRSVNRSIRSRLDDVVGLSSTEKKNADKRVWIKPFGSWADQDSLGGVPGFDARTYGAALGADTAASDSVRLGVAGAYAKTELESKSAVAPQDATLDFYQLIGYGRMSLDEYTSVDFQADVGKYTTEAHRQVSFASSIASSEYDSHTAHAGAGIGRRYDLNQQAQVRPSLRIDYTRIKNDAYSEAGAGPINLDVDSAKTEELLLSLEAQGRYRFDRRSAISGDVGIGYDAINERTTVNAAYAGAPGVRFTTRGAHSSPWIGRVGFGASHRTTSGVELFAHYDAEFREQFINQTFALTARYAF